jgi:hypothetical protein
MKTITNRDALSNAAQRRQDQISEERFMRNFGRQFPSHEVDGGTRAVGLMMIGIILFYGTIGWIVLF